LSPAPAGRPLAGRPLAGRPLAGRIGVVTGAGRGLGRQHALLLAAQGARVVVNDLGAAPDGSGADAGPAEAVAAEIRAAGGEAVASTHDVATWEGGQAVVACAVERFGGLDVLVNNAGILRDRFLVNMTEDEWDEVVRVVLKGHAAPTRWAAAWWRERAMAGQPVRASVVNTSSTSGLLGNPGQANYGAAKAGIAAFTVIAAAELARYGVRVNAIAPMARTRLTEHVPGWEEIVRPPEDPGAFDAWDPANVSPLVAWLATEGCPATGRVFYVHGSRVQVFKGWELGGMVEADGRWTVEALDRELPRVLG
jgi:NAD(P)-dependent dehydrogenase (short-subunit alcohol dehydrogenase family)